MTENIYIDTKIMFLGQLDENVCCKTAKIAVFWVLPKNIENMWYFGTMSFNMIIAEKLEKTAFWNFLDTFSYKKSPK